MNISPEEREIGRDNYYGAVAAYEEQSRRDFLKKTVAGAAVAAGGVGAMYFNYGKPRNRARISVIGTGDEGNVLIGALNPDYVEVVSICDIRPSSIHRAFHGDYATPNALAARPGLMKVFGWNDETEARNNVKVVTDYNDVINDPTVDGVIIALPLHLHAIVAIKAMLKNKHVLCEKLMAHNVTQCKLMATLAENRRRFLSVGHQRHYSILYDNAINMIQWGLLGEIHHIRAQWHRGNLPGADSWALPVPGSSPGGKRSNNKIIKQLTAFQKEFRDPSTSSKRREWLQNQIVQWELWDSDKGVDAAAHGYIDDPDIRGDGFNRSAMEELVRWRLWDRTGGGLMAELGSHQLDAASIFISALASDPKLPYNKRKKVHPLTLHAVGGRHIFPADRNAEDHVYCTFEYPGQGYDYSFPVGYENEFENYPGPDGIPSYEEDHDKKIVVTYSSINGNGFGGYGETVMGTRGTLILEREKEVMLYKSASTRAKVGVKKNRAGAAVLDTSASGDAAPAKAAENSGPVSRGYTEEIEHWAWCIDTGNWDNQPRCNGPVAVADAVIALTAKKAIKNSQKPGGNGFVAFDPEWFDINKPAVPEADSAQESLTLMNQERKALGLDS